MGTASSSQMKISNLPDVDVPYIENNYPPLKPPKTKKDIIFNPKLFTAIDDKAMVTSRHVCSSYTGLLQYLTSGLTSDIQKVRSIFVWMSSQQIMYEDYEDVSDVHTPLGYMKLIQEDRGSYEQFFALLCRGAKILCMVVEGHIKGATYEVGERNIDSTLGKWTLAYIDGSWRIINPKWAMVSIANFSNRRWQLMEKDGVLEKHKQDQSLMTYVYFRDDFYFLTDPEDHIFRCLPKNTKWQLLEEPWSMEKFLSVPLVQNDFFKSGLILPADIDGVLLATDGELEIQLEVSDETVNLKYELYFEKKIKKKLQKQKQLSKYVFLNSIRKTRAFVIRFQTEGKYMLTVLNEAEEPLCDFRIDCTGVQNDCKPFPKGPEIGWGFGESARKAGLTNPSVEGGLVDIRKQKSVNFSFSVLKGTEVKANLVHNDVTDHDLQRHLREERTLEEYSVTVEVPSASWHSEYALEVHARDKTSGEYTNVANYLLTTEKSKLTKLSVLPTPSVKNGSTSSKNDSSATKTIASNVVSDTNSKAKTPGSKSVSINGSMKTGTDRKHKVQKNSMFPLFKKPSNGESLETVSGVDPDGLPTRNGTVRSGNFQNIVDETKDKDRSSTSRLAKNKTYSFKIKPNKIADCPQKQEQRGLDDNKKLGVLTSRDRLQANHEIPRIPSNASLTKTGRSSKSPASSPTKEGLAGDGSNLPNSVRVTKDICSTDSQGKTGSLPQSQSPTDNNTLSPRPSLRSSSLLLSPSTPHSPQDDSRTSDDPGKLSVSTIPVRLTSRKNSSDDPGKLSVNTIPVGLTSRKTSSDDPGQLTVSTVGLTSRKTSSDDSGKHSVSTIPVGLTSRKKSTLDVRRSSKATVSVDVLQRRSSRSGVTPLGRRASVLSKDNPGGRVSRQATGYVPLNGNNSSGKTKTKTASPARGNSSPQNSNIISDKGKDKSKEEVMAKSPQFSSAKGHSVTRTPSKSPTVEVICEDLTKAIESRRLSMINNVLDKSVSGHMAFHPKLTELKEKAESVRGVVRRLNKYLHEVMAVNQATIAEIHSYSHPKTVVHDVMRATFLLLGDRGAQLQTWTYVQQLMRRTSKDGLISRIQEFDIRTITIDLADYVKAILDRYDQDEVHVTSTGAGAFYAWCRNILKEVYAQAAQNPE